MGPLQRAALSITWTTIVHLSILISNPLSILDYELNGYRLFTCA